jgi:hypothetical protein
MELTEAVQSRATVLPELGQRAFRFSDRGGSARGAGGGHRQPIRREEFKLRHEATGSSLGEFTITEDSPDPFARSTYRCRVAGGSSGVPHREAAGRGRQAGAGPKAHRRDCDAHEREWLWCDADAVLEGRDGRFQEHPGTAGVGPRAVPRAGAPGNTSTL